MLLTMLYKILARLLSLDSGINQRLTEISAAIERQTAALASQSEILAGLRVDVDKILAAVQSLPAVGFVFTCVLEGQTFEGVRNMILTDVQKFTASIKPVDAKGNPAAVDGLPLWSASDPAILQITPASDGLSAEVLAVGPLGNAQVIVTADADLGEGVVGITGVLEVEVMASAAVALNVTAGPATAV